MIPSFISLGVLVVSVVLNFFLVVTVVAADKKAVLNRVFAVLAAGITLWVGTFYAAEFPYPSLLWSRFSLFFAVPLSVMFYVLAHVLCHGKMLWKKSTMIVAVIVCLGVMAVTMSPYAFTGLEIVSGGIGKPITGPGMLPFSMVTTFFSLLAIGSLAWELKKASNILRRQIIFVLLGMLVTLGLIIGTIMVPLMAAGSVAFVTYAPLYVLFFLTMVAIAVVRYHLFSTKLIATETLVTIMALIVIIEGFTAPNWQQFLLKELLGGAIIAVGYLLAQSVKKETTQREQLAILNVSLEQSNIQFKEANLRLEQLDHQKTEFLSIASHQLRTPLSIINGYVELLTEGGYGKMPTQSLPVFANIIENTTHLVKLVNEFLDIAHIEQGKTKFFFESFNLSDLVSQVVEQVGAQIKDKAVRIVWSAPVLPCTVDADKDKMRDVVFNLVDNAIKYTSRGLVTVSLSPSPETIQFSVKDDGLGFDEYDKVNFFQKFYRGKNVEGINVTGTGLGLYVAGKFIEGHQGKIWCESQGTGKGSTFGFEIPLHQKIPVSTL